MEIEDLNEDVEPKDIVGDILAIEHTKKTLVYALQVHINQFELHLDTITHKYKTMALLWLLATYVAIGFLFSIETKNLQTNSFLNASVVCLFGVIGVSSLWYIDIFTIHKFWGAFFIEGIKMERKYRFLLKMGGLALSLDNVKSRIRGHENCYIFANLLLILSMGIALVLLANSIAWKGIVCTAIILVAFVVIKLMRAAGCELRNAIESLLNKRHSR